MEIVKTLEEKVSFVVEKVKALKEEKAGLEIRISQLEDTIKMKDREIEQLNTEKAKIKGQIGELLQELDSMELR